MSVLGNLAAAISTSSAKIRAYAVAQAAAHDELAARVAALEKPSPVPPPPPAGRVDLSTKATTLPSMLSWLAANPVPAFVPTGTYPTTAILVIPPGCDLEFRSVTIDTRNPGATSLRIHGAKTKLRFTGQCRIGLPGQQYARQPTAEQAGLNVRATDLVVHADDLTIEGVANIALLIWGACARVTVTGKILALNTGADSFHVTGGSTDIDIQAALTSIGSGDDGAACVSYEGQPVNQRIRYRNVTVKDQRWGRGISVVGGTGVTFDKVDIDGSWAAPVYIACEPQYLTHGVDGVSILAATIRRANLGKVHDANVIVYSDRPGKTVANVAATVNPDPLYPVALKKGSQPATNVVVNGKPV